MASSEHAEKVSSLDRESAMATAWRPITDYETAPAELADFCVDFSSRLHGLRSSGVCIRVKSC